ncbi:hypothetical protein AAHE18_10G065800 [Arachis hypogaea]
MKRREMLEHLLRQQQGLRNGGCRKTSGAKYQCWGGCFDSKQPQQLQASNLTVKAERISMDHVAHRKPSDGGLLVLQPHNWLLTLLIYTVPSKCFIAELR